MIAGAQRGGFFLVEGTGEVGMSATQRLILFQYRVAVLAVRVESNAPRGFRPAWAATAGRRVKGISRATQAQALATGAPAEQEYHGAERAERGSAHVES